MVLEFFISNLVTSFSYLGVFIAAGIVSTSIVFPLPAYLIILGAAAFRLDPILVSIMYAAGSMIGELLGWGIGVAGKKTANKVLKKWGNLTKWTERYFKKYGFLTILVTALVIFPFDITSIIAAASRYDIKKWLLAGFLGKFLKTLILMILTSMGFAYFGFLS